MLTLKCKMCGGTIEFEGGKTVVTCEYCKTTQTMPRLDDDRKTNLYDRANHFRRNNEYDKAMSIYEQILNEDNTDAESYWSIVLCRYGIEYVEDPTTHRRVPTVNRAQFTSVLADENYKKALEYADIEQKIIYEAEAHAIDEIQKGILEISNKEEPFDVFICYKETDNEGRRTQDSVLATDLYHQLVQEGFKVFFSRITLEDKLGTAYEPYIFAALNSAKVMVVLGTKPEYFNAVWVKNEWSRYLALVKNSNGKKILIPAYRDMDPYDLPEEFSHLQAQDMSKLGFIQDLIRGIKKITKADETKPVVKETVVAVGNTNTDPLIKRVFICLEDSDWDKADDLCEQVLNQDPENAQAYLGKLMAELHVHKHDDLKDCETPFDDNKNYRNVIRFGDESLSSTMNGYIKHINERNESNRIKNSYDKAVSMMKTATTEEDYNSASIVFKLVPGYKDSDELAKNCLDKAEECRKDSIYKSAREKMSGNSFSFAIKLFKTIPGWKDSDKQIEVCQRMIDEIKAQEEERRLERELKAKKFKKTVAIVTPVAIIFVVLFVVFISVILSQIKLNRAISLLESGDYDNAYLLLSELNQNEMIIANKNDRAKSLLESGDYEAAYVLLQELGQDEIITANKNDRAKSLLESGDYEAAYVLLQELGQDEIITANKNDRAQSLLGSGDYEAAYVLLQEIGQDEIITANKNDRAQSLLESGDYEAACALLEETGNWELLRDFSTEDYKNILRFADYEAACALLEETGNWELLRDFSTEDYKNILRSADLSKGDVIHFGDYNGECEWRVLDVTDNAILIISVNCVDKREFDSDSNEWVTSSLRSWLNGEYYNETFNSTEKSMIMPFNEDNVFLLSIGEAKSYFSDDQDRIAQYYGSSCYWWLCSPGDYSSDAAVVRSYGLIRESGIYVNNTLGVRPALWLNLGS